jgi:hypothetical protein
MELQEETESISTAEDAEDVILKGNLRSVRRPVQPLLQLASECRTG